MACVFRAEQYEPPLDIAALFGTPDVEVEIGCGKGLFLAQASESHPGVGYFGIERAEKYFRRTALRIHQSGCTNARVAQMDAFDALTRWFQPGVLGGVHIYFPDPWPKTRHAARRLLRPSIFPLVARCLRPGGVFRVASDVEPYFVEALSSIASTGQFERVPWPEAAPDRLATNFSKKYEEEGRALHYAKFLRRVEPAQPAAVGEQSAEGCGT